jgi:hypothetical protein
VLFYARFPGLSLRSNLGLKLANAFGVNNIRASGGTRRIHDGRVSGKDFINPRLGFIA